MFSSYVKPSSLGAEALLPERLHIFANVVGYVMYFIFHMPQDPSILMLGKLGI